ncbi:acyltransferase [Tychonema sp. LEGE 07203]|uniref:acyltransferase family protein n=1 Tax=Tychonema sp. LEGE 07203 TaxID=1828671 RepID=UPI001880D60A|nr:acyltransferase [Tychonema sp. LEGE 07203]MBE9095136.1 acyltransferase [Tychonema sp. LEGE 07203]
MTKSSTPHKKLNLLQVYRGIAALLVVMVHLTIKSADNLNQVTFFNLFQAGWSGVDYFFVLSGFIMVYVHRSAIGKQDQLKSFLVKRAVRIYPIYWIVTLTALCLFLIMPGLAHIQDLSLGYVIRSLLLIPQNDKSILEVAGTLMYEINFYLLFSIAVWLKPKHSVPILSAWLFVTILHYRKILNFPQDSFLLEIVFGNMNLEFVFGCLAAYIVMKYNNKIGKYRWILFGIANLGYVILGILAGWGNIWFGRIHTFGVLAAMLIIAATSIDLKDSPKIPYLLIFLGDASYSIYLTHLPVITASTKILQKANLGKYFDGFFAPALLALFAVVFGCIFYSFIEKPLTIYLRKNILEKMFPPKGQARI